MSSKAKSATKKKSGKKDDPKAKEQTVVEQLTARINGATVEIETLKRELAHRDDTILRLKEANANLKQMVEELENSVDERNRDRQELAADSNSQFKKLQHDMQTKVSTLEHHMAELKFTCDTTTAQLNKKIADYNSMVEIKDAIIEEQSTKISCMATEFESMLNETMDKVARKIQQAADQWNGEESLSPENEKRYAEFSLP
ncbi:hypothetical protein BC828DRAFT_391150 [Blastocladiella britannica]|nr:hypothetical protein BC828DRAFT_391150 [Blastocladiella britannica]